MLQSTETVVCEVAGEDVELLTAQLDVVQRVFQFKKLYIEVTQAGDDANSTLLSQLACAAESCLEAPERLSDWMKTSAVDTMSKSVTSALEKVRAARRPPV